MGSRLLWIDGLGAAAAGLGVLALCGWLSELHRLPEGLIVFLGVVNLAYACYSLPLAMASRRSMLRIQILVVANAAWALVCFGLAWAHGGAASQWGLAHLVGEGLYVGALAWLEWRSRSLLAAPE
ncbi:MAG: hypothetical protein AAF725_27730 [Acidobacteriota bacterium]